MSNVQSFVTADEARALHDAAHELHRGYKTFVKKAPTAVREGLRKHAKRRQPAQIPVPARIMSFVYDCPQFTPLERITAIVQSIHAAELDPANLWTPLDAITFESVATVAGAYEEASPVVIDDDGKVSRIVTEDPEDHHGIAEFIRHNAADLAGGSKTDPKEAGVLRLPHGHGLALPRAEDPMPDALGFILPYAVTGTALAVFARSQQAEQLNPGDAILFHRAEPLYIPPIQKQEAYVFALMSHRPALHRIPIPVLPTRPEKLQGQIS